MANPSEMPGATTVAPLTLAAYQEGAVVSRILLKRGGGTVTLFAFDEGQSLSEHTAPFDAVAYVLEGEALITIAGVPLTVPAGDIVLMLANQPTRRRGTQAVQDAADDDPIDLTLAGRPDDIFTRLHNADGLWASAAAVGSGLYGGSR